MKDTLDKEFARQASLRGGTILSLLFDAPMTLFVIFFYKVDPNLICLNVPAQTTSEKVQKLLQVIQMKSALNISVVSDFWDFVCFEEIFQLGKF